ncbi:MAG: ribosome recycling factor [Candidatus Azambacteria bacterium]|nr:ribosome recycling factor [Candidatus Azambacteria bacterium]
MDILENLKSNLKKIIESFKTELSGIRVGRATPALVENMFVDYYGTKTPLKQLASISAPEPRMLIIEPWDKNAFSAIEKAILTSELGLNPIVDKNSIKIIIPQLTEERRDALIKIVDVKLEESKIQNRAKRDNAMKEINDLFSGKKIAEDEKFKLKEKTQTIVDEANKNLEDISKLKEKEIKEK